MNQSYKDDLAQIQKDNEEAIKINSQLDNAHENLARLKEMAKNKYGVDTIEELEALKNSIEQKNAETEAKAKAVKERLSTDVANTKAAIASIQNQK